MLVVAGASSLHLWWDVAGPVSAVAATVEVLRPPAVPGLVFWALQASFSDRGRRFGGGHVGLQAHPSYPGGTAVNWGGYGADGRELSGSVSPLPSALRNANTRDFEWMVGRPYRLTIERAASADGWDASVDGVVVRTLSAGGVELSSPVMWTENFCSCSDPSVAVRWSALSVVRPDGTAEPVRSVRAGYQADGCPNTTSLVDGDGVVQVTAVPRSTPSGAVLRF
jgi:hypothetical protein